MSRAGAFPEAFRDVWFSLSEETELGEEETGALAFDCREREGIGEDSYRSASSIAGDSDDL